MKRRQLLVTLCRSQCVSLQHAATHCNAMHHTVTHVIWYVHMWCVVMSHMNESWITYEWVTNESYYIWKVRHVCVHMWRVDMSHMNESWTYEWVIDFVWLSHWKIHIMYEKWVTNACTYDVWSRHIWMSHGLHMSLSRMSHIMYGKWVTNAPTCDVWTCHIRVVMSHTNKSWIRTYESYHEWKVSDDWVYTWRGHVTGEGVVGESCHIWMSGVIHDSLVWHVNESCHIYVRHVTWERVTSHATLMITYEWVTDQARWQMNAAMT